MTRPRRRLLASLWRPITHGLRTLLRRRESDEDLAAEMAHYLAEAEAELVGRGATPQEARRAVRLRLGDGLSAREDVRTYGWENTVEALLADIRLAARRLRRSPGFTAVAVLTLGLGIGAATAIFSAVRPVLFAPLDYPQADRIIAITDRAEDGSPVPVTFGTYRELAERADAFSALSVFKPWQPTSTGGTEPERLEGQAVSADYFRVLGVAPALGPGFDAPDDRPGGPHRVVLSHALWQRSFGGDPTILGRGIQLDGDLYLVVGVMPAGFENATGVGAQAWTLLQYDPMEASFDSREWGHHLGMIGRLAPGVGLDQARRTLDRIAVAPLPRFPRPAWASMGGGVLTRRLRDAATADARPTAIVLFGAVVLLMMIACVNVTMLFLARGRRRRGELAMREALGAGRSRLVRHLLTESLLLAGLGGALGVVVAQAGLVGLVAASPPTLTRMQTASLDWSALGVVLGLTTLCGLLFGLAPALGRWGLGSRQVLREGGRGSVGRRSAGQALVVAEVAMAMVLLVGAGLLLRSTQRLFSVSPGFEADQVVVLQVYGTGLERGDGVTHRFFDAALEAVRTVPGVGAAVLTNQLPLSGDIDVYGVTLAEEGQAASVDGAAYRYAVSPGYFETLAIPRVRGRALEDGDDATSLPVAVVSETLAKRMFPGRDPLGNKIHLGAADAAPYTIVGVVADVKQASLGADQADAVYVTSHQWHWADRVRWIVVRADRDPAGVVPAVRRAIWSVDGDQPIMRAQTMADLVTRSESRRRFVLVVLLSFAVAALALAGIGLYGVLSGSVADRMREIGVRAALGASRENILGMVVRQGMTLTAMGSAVGIVAAASASEVLVTLLFDVTRLDVVTYASVAASLGLVAALACWIPAARAARMDPLATLRAD